jgi:hypothetical protein
MVEVPVGVDDRGHRLAAGVRGFDDPRSVRRMAATVDDHQPIATLQQHGIAIGLVARHEGAAQQGDAVGHGFAMQRRAHRLRGAASQERCQEQFPRRKIAAAHAGPRLDSIAP